MRYILLFIISFLSFEAKSQIISEVEIQNLAIQINEQIKGLEIGNGVKARGCISSGRTLIYQYEVPFYWQAPENIKEEIISNLKTAGAANMYFLQNINADFYYFKGNSLYKKVSIKSIEFSDFSFELGEYISIKDHPKSKDVNLRIKPPVGWEIKEGDRPNIIKKFVKEDNVYLILIRENITFISRNQSRELFEDEIYLNELTQEMSSHLKNYEVLDKSVVTIDTYPSLQFKVKGELESFGRSIAVVMRYWMIFYEDKIIFLQSTGFDNAQFRALEQLFFLITNSVIFPDQYN